MTDAHPAPQMRASRRHPKKRNHPQPWEHVVSVSGGKDSTALYLLAVERGMPFLPVFADTGHEHPWVYEAVDALPRLTGGPPVITVKADFAARIEGKRRFMEDKWPRLGIAPEYIKRALQLMVPTGNPFLDLCMWKGMFPTASTRFCTEDLKLQPMFMGVQLPLLRAGKTLISWQGIRAEESLARRDLPRWQRINPAPYKVKKALREEAEGYRAYAYRPLIDWTLDDVWAMHERHGVPRNPLYAAGADRVGCFPCIHAGKDELRMIADKFPAFIERLAEWEELVTHVSRRGAKDGFAATFFPASDDPTYQTGTAISVKTHGIHRTVEWARTSRGGKQYDLLLYADSRTSCSEWGTCE